MMVCTYGAKLQQSRKRKREATAAQEDEVHTCSKKTKSSSTRKSSSRLQPKSMSQIMNEDFAAPPPPPPPPPPMHQFGEEEVDDDEEEQGHGEVDGFSQWGEGHRQPDDEALQQAMSGNCRIFLVPSKPLIHITAPPSRPWAHINALSYPSNRQSYTALPEHQNRQSYTALPGPPQNQNQNRPWGHITALPDPVPERPQFTAVAKPSGPDDAAARRKKGLSRGADIRERFGLPASLTEREKNTACLWFYSEAKRLCGQDLSQPFTSYARMGLAEDMVNSKSTILQT
jgi:hypothetical protein